MTDQLKFFIFLIECYACVLDKELASRQPELRKLYQFAGDAPDAPDGSINHNMKG